MSRPAEDILWTSAFLNERFPLPVSPLGWTLIKEPLEDLAFREALRYLGVPGAEEWPLTRLYRGYPFVNVAVFQAVYKVFPDFLLPEDAQRFFPGGDTRLRNAIPWPRSPLDPRLWASLGPALIRHAGLASPWHNAVRWERFTGRQTAELDRLAGGDARIPEAIWGRIEAARRLDRELLAIHRWSITLAEVSYTLLRRLGRAWMGPEADQFCARLVAGLPNRSVELDAALHELASIAREVGDGLTARELAEHPAFRQALERFLERYGHRSFTLDVLHPPFRAAPEQVLALVDELRQTEGPPGFQQAVSERRAAEEVVRSRLGPLRRAIFGHLLDLTRRYMILREDQRFHWQRSLALQRDLFLALGWHWAARGWLERPDDIFFATVGEVEAAVHGQAVPPVAPIRQRRQQYQRLVEESRTAPDRACPPFLRGDEPLWPPAPEETELRGQGVSPGTARGPVRVVLEPGGLRVLSPGDILVTRSTDPGWTPVFVILAGLVMEHGGQLSHGAVVAREYGLPAVAGVAGATRRLRDGELVLVDGDRGIVKRLDSHSVEVKGA